MYMVKTIMQVGFIASLIAPINVEAQLSTEAQIAEEPRLPYEVIVNPSLSISDLNKLIVQVEDDFFDKYNELNLDNDYDVICYVYVPTMSHIRKRVCEPWFLIEARGDNASDVAAGFAVKNAGASRAQTVLLTPNAMRLEKETNFVVLQSKLEEFTRTDLEFRSIGNALGELKDRLKSKK